MLFNISLDYIIAEHRKHISVFRSLISEVNKKIYTHWFIYFFFLQCFIVFPRNYREISTIILQNYHCSLFKQDLNKDSNNRQARVEWGISQGPVPEQRTTDKQGRLRTTTTKKRNNHPHGLVH